MANLVFSAIESLDGYVADEAGKFDWAEPDESVHTFVNDLQRSLGKDFAKMKEEATGNISVGGPDLAARAIEAGLVDEYRLNLVLMDERRFGNGMVYLNYRSAR